MLIGLSQVFLLVSDLARSVQFYQRLLGGTPASRDERHARFALGPLSLTIHEDLMPSEKAIWRVDPMPERRGWGVYLTLRTEDLEGAYAMLTGMGAEILTTPAATPWGATMFLVKDPDGYLLEISRRQ